MILLSFYLMQQVLLRTLEWHGWVRVPCILGKQAVGALHVNDDTVDHKAPHILNLEVQDAALALQNADFCRHCLHWWFQHR